jgi:hypothetical protein
VFLNIRRIAYTYEQGFKKGSGMEIRRGRNRILTIVISLFVLAVVVAGATLGYFWYQKSHSPEGSTSGNSPGGSISLDMTEKVETENLQTALALPKPTDKPGDTIKVSILSITVPKVWRTINGKNIINTPLESVYAQSSNDILAQLVMVPEKNPTDPIQATNSLSFYNVTSWMGKPSQGTNGTASSAAKTAYIQNIANIGQGQPADKNVCAKGYGVLNVSICGDLLKSTPVMTADGSLSGVTFLTTQAQAISYDPQAVVFLTGKVKEQQIFGYGTFHLLDNNSHTLSAADTASVKAAWDAFAGGTVPNDTQQLYQHVIDAVKSIRIQANE